MLEDKIFIDHLSSENFNPSSTCSIDDARRFLMTTFDNLHRLEPSAMIQNVFIVGGWNNNNYITLKSKINIICDQCNRGMKENSSFPGRLLRAPYTVIYDHACSTWVTT